MNDYILLMHNDSTESATGSESDAWGPYLAKLRASGHFQGGSSIGTGVCVNKAGTRVEISSHIVGHLRVSAESVEQARELVIGNPVFEAGGTVEIREMPRT
jgi:hypothetical protein